MADRGEGSQGTGSRGCLTTAAAGMVLTVVAPVALIVQRLRVWRRGPEVHATLDGARRTGVAGSDACRFDLALDIPAPAEPGIRRRLTDVVVRVAERLHRADDVYNLLYRLPRDSEPVVVAIGPQLQALGDRLFMVLSQGALEGRTAAWVTLARDRPLSALADPIAFRPDEADELEALLAHPEVRWSMATEWARVGPSLVIRLILVVPTESQDLVRNLLSALATGGQRSVV